MAVAEQRNSVPTIATAAVIIAALSFASRLLGLFRDRLLAATFGAGPLLDAYYTAFRIPDFIFNLLGLGALSAAFLPLYIRLRGEHAECSRVFAAKVLSDIVVILCALCAVGAIAAPIIYRILAPGFPPDELATTVSLGRVMLLATFLLGCSTVAGGILQAEARFVAFAAAPLLYNLGIILGIVVFVPIWGTMGLAWGVVVGAAFHLVVQWIAARRVGFRPSWQPSWRDSNVRRAMTLLVPRILGLASDQFQLVVFTAIASTLAHGTLAVFMFASNIQSVPVSLFGISFAVAAFPYLAAAAYGATLEKFREQFSISVRNIALLAFPAIVILIALKAQVVRALLGAGAFDWDATLRTLGALEVFGIGLFWVMLVPLLARSFYALEDTWTPFAASVIANIIGITIALPFGRSYGARGLAFAFIIAATIQAVTLLVLLRARVGPLDGRRIAMACAKFAVAAFAMAIAIQILKPIIANRIGTTTFIGIGLQGAVAAVIGIAVYLTVGILLRSAEITELAHALRRRALRVVRLPFGGAEEARG